MSIYNSRRSRGPPAPTVGCRRGTDTGGGEIFIYLSMFLYNYLYPSIYVYVYIHMSIYNSRRSGVPRPTGPHGGLSPWN